MKIYTLYKTINSINGKYYIGVHVTEDLAFGTNEYIDPYIGSGKILNKALKKYGRNNFIVEIIAYFDTKKYAYNAEMDLVTNYWIKTNKKKIYNIIPGGCIPPKSTAESISKSVETRKKNGFKRTEESKKLMSNIMTGKYTGEIYVNNGTKIKRVKENKIPKGFTKGTLPCYTEKRLQSMREKGITPPSHKGKITITNGIKEKRIFSTELIPKEWARGTIRKDITPPSHKGKIIITNGLIQKFIFPLDDIPQGWVRGNLRNLKNKL